MLRRILSVSVLALPLLVACGSDPTTSTAMTAPGRCDDGGAGPYFFFDDAAWKFREAVDYPGELRVPRAGLPTDWYVEYERMTPTPEGTRGDSLGLTGRPISIETYPRELPEWEPQERTVEELPALAGELPGGRATMVAIAVEDGYAVELVSYGLAVDELLDVAGEIRQVCQTEWVSAGGQLAGCLPTDAGCVASTTTTTSPEPATEAPLATTTTSTR